MAALILLATVASAHEGLHGQIAEVTARIKRAPRDATLYLKRGELYRLHQDWRRASADYDRAARLQPALAVVDLARGKMLFEAGRPTGAMRALDSFLLNQPKHVEAHVTRARVLVKLGRRIEAERDFTTAINLTSTPQPELYIERARSLADAPGSNMGDTIEALRGLDEGLTKLGPLVTLQLYAIDLELRRENYDSALARLANCCGSVPAQRDLARQARGNPAARWTKDGSPGSIRRCARCAAVAPHSSQAHESRCGFRSALAHSPRPLIEQLMFEVPTRRGIKRGIRDHHSSR